MRKNTEQRENKEVSRWMSHNLQFDAQKVTWESLIKNRKILILKL
jgi:hypothetical protein